MLNLVLISLDEFIFKKTNLFNQIIKEIAIKFNFEINEKLQNKLNNIFIQDIDIYDSLIKELSKEWKIDDEKLAQIFIDIGNKLLSTNKFKLPLNWLNTFNDLTSHQIKIGLISIFSISNNIFQNYENKNFDKFFIQINNNDIDEAKDKILNFISNQICQPSETLLITNKDFLFEVAIQIDVKVFSTLDNVSKNFVKTNQIICINSEPNAESWIYDFQDDADK
ncbi:hypothetical protein [Mycoplasmoides alvi]|uniref:hypothetical protein n=1 Tax=Mycoplasmoides alvi TaxID=78580 RepID=UPI00051ADED9|nr:hypothetical protein [Mycoplasmoides alvi]